MIRIPFNKTEAETLGPKLPQSQVISMTVEEARLLYQHLDDSEFEVEVDTLIDEIDLAIDSVNDVTPVCYVILRIAKS